MKKKTAFFHDLKLNWKFTFLVILFTMVPIGVFAGILFYILEQNEIKESMKYMEYTMERTEDAIASKIDSINMSTQFFLSDDALLEVLNRVSTGDIPTNAEWYEFKDVTVSSLERLVYNNPLLYGVRVYGISDEVQEMMPILYQASRMKKQSWSKDETLAGWKYNYSDEAFSAFHMSNNRKLIGLITPVIDNENGLIGVIESAMTMENMFPGLYENIENEWTFFYTDDKDVYYGMDQIDALHSAVESEIIEELSNSDTLVTIYRKIQKQKLVISYMPVRELGGILVYVKNISDAVNHVYWLRNVFVILMVTFLIILAFLINRIVQVMLKDFYEILKSIRKVQKGDLSERIKAEGKTEMDELGTQINKMLDRINQLMTDNLQRERLMKNSEIRALQNQINAHFIYNVLESIKMMAEIEEKYEISDAITALGRLLRYSMRWVSGNVKVEEELEYIKNYMALINLRFDYEIYLSLNIPDIILQQEIPKMSLQPIVENAIYHGIEQLAEDTNIYIKGYLEGEDCIIEIQDSGQGMSESQVEELRRKIQGEIDSNGGSGNGIGLKNVQDRIQIAFGKRYGIEIASMLGVYTKIRVRIPVTFRGEAKELT